MAINVKANSISHELAEKADISTYDWNADVRNVSALTFLTEFRNHHPSAGMMKFKICAPSTFSPTKEVAWMWGVSFHQTDTEWKILAICGAELYVGLASVSGSSLSVSWRKCTSTAV